MDISERNGEQRMNRNRRQHLEASPPSGSNVADIELMNSHSISDTLAAATANPIQTT
ncbi:MAG: hypothetical protein R3C42_00175 [Parvularculaceae bacterium]